MDRECERAQARVGADVARRLLAADVLLACRERQHEASPPFRVHCLACETAWHLAHVLGARCEQADVRAAEIEGIADSLSFTDRDVGVHLAGRAHGVESVRIGKDRNQERAVSMRGRGYW